MIGRQVGFYLTSLILLGLSPDALACRSCVVRCHRSLDFLACESPVIICGEVEDLPVEDEDGVAVVRVLSVLKGTCTHKRITVDGRSLLTGAIMGWGESFTVGQRSMFLLPVRPVQGKVKLLYCRSVLPLGSQGVIEARILRARLFRLKYRARVDAAAPETARAARELAGAMRTHSESWPEFASPIHHTGGPILFETPKPPASGPYRALREVPVEVIRLVTACEPEDEPWLEHTVWLNALEVLAAERKAEIVPVERARIRAQLLRIGVSARETDAWLACVPDGHFRGSLRFPFRPPLRLPEEPGPITTDFLLRYHSLDRGWMYAAYHSRSSTLKKLELPRVRTFLAAMLGSDDVDLRRVAQDALYGIPGPEPVRMVLDELMGSNRPRTLRALTRWRDPERKEMRLLELLSLAGRRLTQDRERTRFWTAVREQDCFENVLIDAAIGALAKSESSSRRLQRGYRDFLDAAMAARQADAPAHLTPNGYRSWFKEHPAPK